MSMIGERGKFQFRNICAYLRHLRPIVFAALLAGEGFAEGEFD